MASTHSKHITPSMRKTCEGCGVEGKKTSKAMCKDCGTVNRQVSKQKANRARKGNQHLPPLLFSKPAQHRPDSTCNVCGKTYKPRSAELTTCCGRTCGTLWSGFKSGLRKTGGRLVVRTMRNVKVATCIHCGAEIANSAAKYCSPECAKVVRHTPRTFDCSECGCTVSTGTSDKRRAYCSEACSKRACRRTARKKERATLRKARVESVDPNKVFDRDGWRCQLCGVKTPRSKRGTYHDKAPELDHVQPLSLGGEHSYRNTQCACRACNLKKSNTPMGQLSLL